MIFVTSQRSRKEQMRGDTALHPLEPYTNLGEVVLTRVPVWDVPELSSPMILIKNHQKLPFSRLPGGSGKNSITSNFKGQTTYPITNTLNYFVTKVIIDN